MYFFDECYALGRRERDDEAAAALVNQACHRWADVYCAYFSTLTASGHPECIATRANALFSYIEALRYEWANLTPDNRRARCGELWRRCVLFARDADEKGGREFTDFLALAAKAVDGSGLEYLTQNYIVHGLAVFQPWVENIIDILIDAGTDTDTIASVLGEIEGCGTLYRYNFTFNLVADQVDEDRALRLRKGRCENISVNAATPEVAYTALVQRVFRWDRAYLERIYCSSAY